MESVVDFPKFWKDDLTNEQFVDSIFYSIRNSSPGWWHPENIQKAKSELLRRMKPSQIIRAIKEYGFILKTEDGSRFAYWKNGEFIVYKDTSIMVLHTSSEDEVIENLLEEREFLLRVLKEKQS
jgi:predicted RNA binding protein YcfA (HicA-like mRNA interferase family)